MLLALRAWREGHALYDEIPTFYGPFYFEFVAAIHRILPLPLDNAGARWFSLGIWISSSLLVAASAYRVHRSLPAALLAWTLAFGSLGTLVREPLHPSGVIVLLLAVASHAALGLSARSPKAATWGVLGALSAAIALTKPNVGVFLSLAVLGTWLRFAGRGGGLLAARSLFALVLVALPFVLMRPLLDQGWVLDFALLAAVSFLPFGLLLFLPSGPRPSGSGGIVGLAAGTILAGGVTILLALAAGSSLPGMFEQLVLAAARFPAQVWHAPDLPPRAAILASLALVPVALVLRSLAHPAGRVAFAILRCLAAVHTLYRCADFDSALAAILPLWILALPGRDVESPEAERPAFFLALAVALLALQVFPIAGSQVGFFAFLLPLAGLRGIASAWLDLPEDLRARMATACRRAVLAGAPAAAAIVVAGLHPGWRELPGRWRAYHELGVDLALPGTESIRLPAWRVAEYAWVSGNLRRNADVFLGMPGYQSLHLWSGVAPPVPFYTATWPLLAGEEEQQRLADALLERSRPCILRVPARIEAWRRERGLVDRAMARTIRERFQVAGRAFGFEFLLPREAGFDLVLTASRVPLPAAGASTGRDSVALRLAFPPMEETTITRLALVEEASGTIACDTAAVAPAARMVLADKPADGGLAIRLDARLDLFVICPASAGLLGDANFYVAAYDASGEIAARLPVEL